MIEVGSKITYKGTLGIVKSILDDMVIVTMADNLDYALPYSVLREEGGGTVVPPESFSGIMEALRPNLKNVNFLNDLAKEMSKAGVSELIIRNGAIHNFAAKESLDEKMAKYKAEALRAAEEKARQEFESENGTA